MRYEDFNKKVIEGVGGEENIISVSHCMTRLRFVLKDRNKTDTKKLKKLNKVIDVVDNNVSYQVIVGIEVADIYNELLGMLDLNGEVVNNNSNKSMLQNILSVISESMTPMLPAMMAAGILAGILALLKTFGIVSETNSTYVILDTLRASVFTFLPVFIAYSAAKKFNTSPILAILIAVTLMAEPINGKEGLTFLGIPLLTVTYSSTFIPTLLSVFTMSKVEIFIKKMLPQSLNYFFSPVLIVLITLPITLFVFGPIGTIIGECLGTVIDFLMNTTGNWTVLAIYAAIQPFLIMMGAGNFIFPVVFSMYEIYGYDPIFMVAMMISDIAVCGSMFGYFIKAKNKKEKQLFGTASFSAFMGITEPAIFGGFVKYRRPFIAVIIAAGISGTFAGLFNVKAHSMVGLLGIAAYLEGGNTNFIVAVASVVLSFIIAAISAYLLGYDSDEPEEIKVGENIAETVDEVVTIVSPVQGTVKKLNEIDDKVFSSEAVGKGIVVSPINGQIVSPIAGVITALLPSKHAVGITSAEGIKLLLHVGIDTVELNGKGFTSFIKIGDHVEKGDLLLNADVNLIKNEGYNSDVIMVVTNSNDYLDIVCVANDDVKSNQELLKVVM